MRTVGDILRTKGREHWSISADATVYEGLQLMAEKNIGALLVLESGKLTGIFSERDYARKIVLKGKSSLNTPIREIMSERVYFVRPDQALEECMGLMTEARVRHLPVLEGDQLAGVISIGDVVKMIISDQEVTIQQLENYILGRGYGQ